MYPCTPPSAKPDFRWTKNGRHTVQCASRGNQIPHTVPALSGPALPVHSSGSIMPRTKSRRLTVVSPSFSLARPLIRVAATPRHAHRHREDSFKASVGSFPLRVEWVGIEPRVYMAGLRGEQRCFHLQPFPHHPSIRFIHAINRAASCFLKVSRPRTLP